MLDSMLKISPVSISLDDILATGKVPDFIIRKGIRHLLKQRLEELSLGGEVEKFNFLETLKSSRIAVKEELANEQHYEVPSDFFVKCLGPNLKYSCSLFEEKEKSLEMAEIAMFDLVAQRAELRDGQNILELGCGWGSLSLYLARKFPNAKVKAISNSKTQKEYIDSIIAKEGIVNLKIETANVVEYTTSEKYDRVVSVEMFEHMRNYSMLLSKISEWLNDDGKLFVHIFCHKKYSYPYEVKDETDWMTKYFFEGGIMPSYDIFTHFNEDLHLQQSWKINGLNYSKTCEAWLKNMDDQKEEILEIFSKSYPQQEKRWFEYWRIFHMACSELFKMNGGNEWFVGHYLLRK